jgi:2-haloacid dehalogenase
LTNDTLSFMSAIDFRSFDALTFDCHGTLTDWETGILDALRPVLEAHGAGLADEPLLEAFARHEAALEAGPHLRCADVLPDLTTADLKTFADLATA